MDPKPALSRRWSALRLDALSTLLDHLYSGAEEGLMTSVISKSFDVPDETRTPDRTKVEVVRLGRATVARLTFLPGWRWSEHVQPVAATDSCQARHVGTIVAGRLHVVHVDGTEADVGPGDAYVIEPGHDAWVVGDEAAVAFEFDSAETYARR